MIFEVEAPDKKTTYITTNNVDVLDTTRERKNDEKRKVIYIL